MTASGEPLIVNRNTLTEAEGGGGIVVNTTTYDYVELDAVGLAMWRALLDTESIPAAVEVLLTRFDVDRETLTRDLETFVGQLRDVGLVGDASELGSDSPPTPTLIERYLDLLAGALTGILTRDSGVTVGGGEKVVTHIGVRAIGADVPSEAVTMIGLARLNNVRSLVERALLEETPGDLVETGVWRGGATIMMRGVLAAHGVTDRTVWACDSFAGLPESDVESFPVDAFWAKGASLFAVPQDEVRRNFERFGLPDDQVRFVEGWFSDTLPTAPIESIAVLRLDGDLYESTSDALTHLYPKVSPGGFVIIDDYVLESCRLAVDDYRSAQGITAEMRAVDWNASWWQKPALS